ncbi:MAG: lysine 2,3-aminomutase [Deltaproteobacteria bacterium]|nr:lysine 2,3-aminomutase [Deltaproteobacteria bacterium]MBN2671280.1 lysine 2,3-aminomutase [Deltaproteobacteria bacterium]
MILQPTQKETMSQKIKLHANNTRPFADASWKEQLKHLITTVDQLREYVNITEQEKTEIEEAMVKFPMAITPYYASLMDPEDPRCPVRKQAIPTSKELIIANADIEDPLAEDHDSPVPGITHRYPDRVLLLVSNQCAMFCRHCTRKRMVGDDNQHVNKNQLNDAINYIRNTPGVRDVLISGGDPFLLSTKRLDWILTELNAIEHVEIVRIGTRTPVVLPQRIDDELIAMLKKHQPVWVNTHFNHPREVTEQSKTALRKLADAGIPLGNQSVLLRDVNDCPMIIQNLVHRMVENRVRPYYLYQCDLSRGIEHFRTSISKGIEIMEMLIGHTSGFAVPTYVVDAPGGGGKIPVMPNYLISMGSRKMVLRNYEGVICLYSEPPIKETTCPPDCDYCDRNMPAGQKWAPDVGVGKLFDQTNDVISIVPENLERVQRRTYDASEGTGEPQS